MVPSGKAARIRPPRSDHRTILNAVIRIIFYGFLTVVILGLTFGTRIAYYTFSPKTAITHNKVRRSGALAETDQAKLTHETNQKTDITGVPVGDYNVTSGQQVGSVNGVGTTEVPGAGDESHQQKSIEEIDRVVTESRSVNEPSHDLDVDREGNKTEGFQKEVSFTYALGPKITNWDQKRKQWLSENPAFSNHVNGKPRIMLVTGTPSRPCDNPVGEHYMLKSMKNKIDYCRLHGIEFYHNMADLDENLDSYWGKLPLLRTLMMSHPEIEWFWWMDSDAFFTDMVFEVPISNYSDYNMVLSGYPDLVFKHKSWIGLNAGIFLLRNCQWSLDLIDAWAPMGQKGRARKEAGKILSASLKGRPLFDGDDQSTLVYLLITKKDELKKKVYLENRYVLHGFWRQLVDRYEEMKEKHHAGLGDDRWPFITHFVGCKPCGLYPDYPFENCSRGMERALNFADDQVLEQYGFGHRGLLSPSIKRIRNEITTPLEYVDKFSIPLTLKKKA